MAQQLSKRQDPQNQPSDENRQVLPSVLPLGSGTLEKSSRRALTTEQTVTSAPPELMVETDYRFPKIFGYLIILLAFGFVGGWAAVAQVETSVNASGFVTVDSYRKTVQHLEGGIVRRILVRDGDWVEAGDVVLELDETQARASYQALYRRYLGEMARLARLEAEFHGHAAIVFPEVLLSPEPEGRERAERVMATESREFEARRFALQGQVRLLEQRIVQLHERMEGLQAQYQAKLTLERSFTEDLRSHRQLAERQLVATSDIRPMERQLAEAQGDAGQLRADMARTRMEIAETELQILQLQREFERDVAGHIRETSRDVDIMAEDLAALVDTLRRKQVRAPVSGEVVGLTVHAEWAVISAGEPLMDIVPEGEPLIIEARVRPTDIDLVRPGMEANLRFTSFSIRRTPTLRGEVVFISADRLQEAEGGGFFLARVQVPVEELEKLPSADLRPGMPVDVMFNTERMTPLTFFVKPLMDGLAVAFVEGN